MAKGDYKLGDVKIGNHIIFLRPGIEDFRMYWAVIGFHGNMIRVKIAEMGNYDELYIDASDIEILLDVNDMRYTNPNV